MTAAKWVRYELPPWERQHGHMAQYALYLPNGDRQSDNVVVLGRGYMPKARRVVWFDTWYPAGCRGPRPSIALCPRFATRTLKACQMLVELYHSTKPPQNDEEAPY